MIKLALFDHDGVFVSERNTWQSVRDLKGIPNVFKLYPKENYRELRSFSDELMRQEHTTKDDFEKVIEGLEVEKDARGVVKELSRRYRLGIVSHALRGIVEGTISKLGLEGEFDYVITMEPLFNYDNEYVSAVRLVPWGNPSYINKGKIVRKIVEEEGLTLSEVAYVGDGPNDIPVFELEGVFGIAYRPMNESVSRAANVTVHDLEELLEYL